MKDVSRSSGPTCLSVKVSRESKREGGALAVARHRTLRRARLGTAERRANLRADAERSAAMGRNGGERETRTGSAKRRDIPGRYSPSQVPAQTDYAFVPGRVTRATSGIASPASSAVAAISRVVYARWLWLIVAVGDDDEHDGARRLGVDTRKKKSFLSHGFLLWLIGSATRNPYVD